MKKTNKKGFTLIELIVVIAILAVLGLLLVPQITGYIAASKKAVGEANAKGCYSTQAILVANAEANLGIVVTADPKCKPVPATGPLTGAAWTDKDNSVYTYTASTGAVTVTKP